MASFLSQMKARKIYFFAKCSLDSGATDWSHKSVTLSGKLSKCEGFNSSVSFDLSNPRLIQFVHVFKQVERSQCPRGYVKVFLVLPRPSHPSTFCLLITKFAKLFGCIYLIFMQTLQQTHDPSCPKISDAEIFFQQVISKKVELLGFFKEQKRHFPACYCSGVDNAIVLALNIEELFSREACRDIVCHFFPVCL